MKTLADFKRDATSGKIKLELFERYGETGEAIPERCRGIRTVQKVNTVGIMLVTDNGMTSELRFTSAKLVEYDGKSLTIYEAGQRELTAEEQRILDEWQRIEKEYYEKNPYGESYWKKKDYFKNCPCPWLAGFEMIRGKKLLYNGKVLDNQVRGNVILKYNVYAQ